MGDGGGSGGGGGGGGVAGWGGGSIFPTWECLGLPTSLIQSVSNETCHCFEV